MKITIKVTNAQRAVLTFSKLGSLGRRYIDATTKRLGLRFEMIVKTQWLAGRALHRRTGTLARSINTRFTITPNESTATTGTNKWYGRLWELTGTRAYTIVARSRRALFWAGAAHPVKSVVHPAVAAKPFLRPALREFQPTIRQQYALAMRDAIAASRGGYGEAGGVGA